MKDRNSHEGILTICTVSYKHKDLIKANIDLVKKMNPGARVDWIVVENTPNGAEGGLSVGETNGLRVIQGISNDFSGIASASYHHASGLNKAIKEVKTRYALILDPDFYIVRKNWIQDVLGRMQKKNLSFFGAPYNPKRYMKYRYFPCIHCVFIDLEKVNKEELDFSPRYKQKVLLANREMVAAKKQQKTRVFYDLFFALKRHARIIIKRSVIIGSSRDTGYALYEKYFNNLSFASECATPVFKPGLSKMNPWYLTSFLNLFSENFFPDGLCYVPKMRSHYTTKGFSDLGYSDVFSKGWDEFMWNGVPFGFHLQGAKKDGTTTDHSEEIPELLHIFDFFSRKEKNKTIFISMFEGVESKNILRTGVVTKLLDKHPEITVVLFMKNKERAEYYAKEFSDSRIIYEVAEFSPNGWLEKFFSLRKFLFLQTETTDLRAKMIAEDRGIAYYYYSLVVHRIMARALFIRAFRILDILLVKDNFFDHFFKKYNPDLVFLANLFEDTEVNFLRAAKKYDVFSVGLINSWDRVTARCILRILPNKLIVFNDNVKEEVVKTNHVHPENILVSGVPQYDRYFSPVTTSEDEFRKRFNLQKDDRLILYSPIGGMFSNSDWEMIDLLYALNDAKKFGDNVKILVSFPPNDFIREEELKKRPNLLYQYIGTRFSQTRSTDWEITPKEFEGLKETLHFMSLIVCYSSSISIDAAIFAKPVININFEIKDNKKLSKSPMAFYTMTHYAKAIGTGGIRLVANKEELADWVKKYLNDPLFDSEGRARLVSQQCTFTDGRSAERIAGFLSENLPQ